jgi:hypothetical protein
MDNKSFHISFLVQQAPSEVFNSINNVRGWWSEKLEGNSEKLNDEWNGTKMIFEISKQDNKTKLEITHFGLVPEFECFDACSKGWTHYLQNSLLPLIISGIGKPDKK